MSSRQTWPLSQTANKASGICSCCHATRQLHKKDGTINLHGPLSKRCPGSNQPPLSSQPLQQQHQQSTGSTMSSVTHVTLPAATTAPCASTSAVVMSSRSTTAAMPSTFSHPQQVGGLIKHIPKSARPACATHLTSLLNQVSQR
jgi:hypothetical protein